MTSEDVGDYVGKNFVASYQKVGTFQIVNGQKQGGNVASYFCLPDGTVLHAVAGPLDAKSYLRELRWVVDTYRMGVFEAGQTDRAFRAFISNAHTERLQRMPGSTRQSRVHSLLAREPLPRLDQVYRRVFENILGERVSTLPVNET